MKTMNTILKSLALLMITACANGRNASSDLDSFKTDNGLLVTLHPLIHGSLYITVNESASNPAGETCIYMDPVISLLPDGGDFTAHPKADFIFVSHNHHDHLDTLAVSQLSKEGTVVFSDATSARELPCAQVMAYGDSKQLKAGISVCAVPAYNTSEEKQNFHPKGFGNGYVLDIDGCRIYVAGDTEDIEEMAQLKDIDIALLPCNLPFTMTPEQLAAAARVIQPKVLFPYHYGQTDVEQVKTLLSDTSIDVRIRQYQ